MSATPEVLWFSSEQDKREVIDNNPLMDEEDRIVLSEEADDLETFTAVFTRAAERGIVEGSIPLSFFVFDGGPTETAEKELNMRFSRRYTFRVDRGKDQARFVVLPFATIETFFSTFDQQTAFQTDKLFSELVLAQVGTINTSLQGEEERITRQMAKMPRDQTKIDALSERVQRQQILFGNVQHAAESFFASAAYKLLHTRASGDSGNIYETEEMKMPQLSSEEEEVVMSPVLHDIFRADEIHQ